MQALQAATAGQDPDLYPQYLRQATAFAAAAQAPPTRKAGIWDFYCFNCDGGGHHAYMCPSPRRDGRAQPPPQQQQQRPPFVAPAGQPSAMPQRPSQRPPFRPRGGKGGKGGGGRGQPPPDRRAMAHAALAAWQSGSPTPRATSVLRTATLINNIWITLLRNKTNILFR